MRTSSSSGLLAAALAGLAAATTAFDCSSAVVDGVKFDLHELGGPRAVVTTKFNGASYLNTSYTVDICRSLERSEEVPKGDECPMGTRGEHAHKQTTLFSPGVVANGRCCCFAVCAIRRLLSLDGKQDTIQEVIALAGDLETQGGGALDANLTRLIPDDDATAAKRDGLRVVLNGGAHFLHDPASKKRKQHAVIDFLCDKDKTGTEGFWSPEDHWKGDGSDEGGKEKIKRTTTETTIHVGRGVGVEEVWRRELYALNAAAADDDKKKDNDEDKDVEDHEEHQLKYDNSALIWDSYGPSEAGEEDKADVLKLTWYTKLVCPDSSSPDDGKSGDDSDVPSSSSWGFFTWLVIIVFLGTAAYLILGSWFNYQRFGARGWDLLPHGDVIRDIPYLIGDWVRKVLNTVQGSGARGGYTAV
jgi:hypothetical protein